MSGGLAFRAGSRILVKSGLETQANHKDGQHATVLGVRRNKARQAHEEARSVPRSLWRVNRVSSSQPLPSAVGPRPSLPALERHRPHHKESAS